MAIAAALRAVKAPMERRGAKGPMAWRVVTVEAESQAVIAQVVRPAVRAAAAPPVVIEAAGWPGETVSMLAEMVHQAGRLVQALGRRARKHQRDEWRIARRLADADSMGEAAWPGATAR
jgi:hypothetical protein